MQDFVFFTLQHLVNRNTCPAADNACDHLFIDRILQQRTLFLHCIPFLFKGFELCFLGWNLTILDLGSFVEVTLTFCSFCFMLERLNGLLDLRNLAEDTLLVLETILQFYTFLFKVCKLFFDLFKTRFVLFTLFHLERFSLYLKCRYLALDAGKLCRLTLNLHLQLCCGLVNKVDRFVRQESVGNVAVREFRRRHQCPIGDHHIVVCLQSFFDSSEDLQRFIDAWLIHFYRLETSLQRSIFFEVLSVLFERSRTDGMQLSTCQCRLQNVRSIHASLTRSRTDNGVDLIDEENDIGCFFDFINNCFKSVFEFPAVLCTRDQAAHVK